MARGAFEMPDMEDLAKQLQEATEKAQEAMDASLEHLDGLEETLGALSGLGAGMPRQLDDLGQAIGGFAEQHETNVESLAGDPDWELRAKVTVGDSLEVAVAADLSVETVRQAWSSTQGDGFESLVGETLAAEGVEIQAGEMGQILEQLSKGRSVAVVKGLEVLACRIQGAPKDAKETLRLSPEANIPLVMDQGGLGFELAPMLTIRNKWENADLPTFTPMGQEIIVPLELFDKGDAFDFRAEPKGQEDAVVVELSLRPLG